jgi:hypothetical protein
MDRLITPMEAWDFSSLVNPEAQTVEQPYLPTTDFATRHQLKTYEPMSDARVFYSQKGTIAMHLPTGRVRVIVRPKDENDLLRVNFEGFVSSESELERLMADNGWVN